MRKTTLLCTLIVAAVAVATSGTSRADRLQREAERKSTVTVSGQYSGSLEGTIWLEGKRVVITRKTALHSVEDGRIRAGYHVVRRPLYVSGVMERDGVIRANLIVVRAQASGKRPAPTEVDPDEGS